MTNYFRRSVRMGGGTTLRGQTVKLGHSDAERYIYSRKELIFIATYVQLFLMFLSLNPSQVLRFFSKMLLKVGIQ